MGVLTGKVYELVTGLAELSTEMEMKFSSFEVTINAIDLLNEASCFIERQAEEIAQLKQREEIK